MKKFVIFLLLFAILTSTSLSEKRLTLAKKNHAKLSFKGVEYILESYIVMFENPYYIISQYSI